MKRLAFAVVLWLSFQSVEASASICDRTVEVQTAIQQALDARTPKDCAAITSADLSQITRLSVVSKQGYLSLEPRDFAGLTSLEVISFQAENLSIRNSSTFQQNPKLKEFYPRSFGVVALDSSLFQGLGELRKIGFQWASPEYEPKALFRNLPSLEQLSLSVPWISTGVSSRKTQVLSDDMFSGSVNLKQIYISSNRFTTVSKDAFRGLVNLESLSLSNNYLSDLPEGLFADLVSLKELDLSRNQIKSLSVDQFSSLKALVKLDLKYNSSLPPADVDAIEALYAGQIQAER